VAVVDLLEAALEAQGAAIEVVRDAGALAQALTGPAFDVVLLDLSPLGAHVATALAALRRHSATARIVVISGSTANATDLPAVDAWVRKPFEVADVLRALASR
jgi:CheY-like chemotaxis protein